MNRIWIPAFLLFVSLGCVQAAFAQQRERHSVILGTDEATRAAREHWDKAKRLADEKKWSEAIKELTWCMNKSKQAWPEFDNCMATESVVILQQIAKFKKEADQVLKKRRDKIEQAFRDGKGTAAQGVVLSAINQAYADWGRTQELYNELGEKGGKTGKAMQRELFMFIEDSLLEDGEYEALLKGAGDGPGALETRMAWIDGLKKGNENIDDKIVEEAKLHLCKSAARYYTAMLALRKTDEAETLADEYLKYCPKGPAYVLFMKGALRVDKYATARNLGKQAKKDLPENEYTEFVEAEAKAIPKGKADEASPKGGNGKKQEAKGGKSKGSDD